mgnify:CR=1 FL=1
MSGVTAAQDGLTNLSRMPSLPVAAALALHGTHALAARPSQRGELLRAAWGAARPRGVELLDDGEWLQEWADGGETVLFVALPRPGMIVGLPPGLHADVMTAAISEGQVILGGTRGGLATCTVTEFGPIGDRGRLLTWTAYPAPVVPRHVVEATDLAALSRGLLTAIADSARRLESLGGAPWRPGDTLPADPITRPLAVPRTTPAPAILALDRATRVAALARAGLAIEDSGAALDAATSRERAAILRGLLGTAEDTIVGATNIATMVMAGWRPA